MTEPTNEELDPTLRALLASPTVWSEVPAHLERDVVADVTAAAAVDRAGVDRAGVDRAGTGRRTAPPAPSQRRFRLLAAAAAVLVLSGVAVVASLALTNDGGTPGIAVALASEDPDGSMTASAVVDRTGRGVKIVLDPAGLPPAAAGTYYQAWLTNDVDRVSAGTFHLRGTGRGHIELWCGVDDPSYSTLALTLERVDSSEIVLVGRIDD